jgi:predicted metal-dependent phosphoesterase TrpH
MKADLHIHTQESDGETTLKEIIDTAKQRNLSCIAITDHDKSHTELDNPIENYDGLSVIKGIELRVKHDKYGKFDILGYGVKEKDLLREEMKRIGQGRKERAKEVVGEIEEDYDTSLDIDIGERTGRPHIARSIDRNKDMNYSYQESFNELIGNGCEYYKSRYITDFERALRILNQSCLITSLAHPYRYDNTKEILENVLYNLDGVEVFYPYSDRFPIEKLKQYSKIFTGGSDAHSRESVGKCGLDEEYYSDFMNLFRRRYDRIF